MWHHFKESIAVIIVITTCNGLQGVSDLVLGVESGEEKEEDLKRVRRKGKAREEDGKGEELEMKKRRKRKRKEKKKTKTNIEKYKKEVLGGKDCRKTKEKKRRRKKRTLLNKQGE